MKAGLLNLNSHTFILHPCGLHPFYLFTRLSQEQASEGDARMRTNRWSLALAVGLMMAAVLACNFSATTANISSLKIGKDEEAKTETSDFKPSDVVYAV